MTVAALRRLLDEIDRQGGPEAARQNRLNLPDEGTQPMSTAPAIPQPPAVDVRLRSVSEQPAEQISVGQLLKWGDDHSDPTVQDQAARARIALHGLRQRYGADRELTVLTSEEEQLEKRLAEVRARKGELAPAKAKKPRKTVDYPAAEVRAWAAANGHDCPSVGRVPKAVVDAWRAANPAAS
ncbi:histone-like nucleoid-structuring protein Lsr2 [Streptomyces sp. NPDC051133]|uniref:Lsr2 family DNA-binding protein n=1 Tax=Streptomyces sp. NPDC051133 TaxID=3155521 RepID=UPI0034252EA9